MNTEIENAVVNETVKEFVLKDELTLKNAGIAIGGAVAFEVVKFGAKKAAPVVAKGVNKVKGLFKRNKDNTDETTEE